MVTRYKRLLFTHNAAREKCLGGGGGASSVCSPWQKIFVISEVSGELHMKRENLTNLYDSELKRAFKKSPSGMMYLAGTGPAYTFCFNCQFFNNNGYYSATNRRRGNQLKPGHCAKYTAYTKSFINQLPPKTPACSYYRENPEELSFWKPCSLKPSRRP